MDVYCLLDLNSNNNVSYRKELLEGTADPMFFCLVLLTIQDPAHPQSERRWPDHYNWQCSAGFSLHWKPCNQLPGQKDILQSAPPRNFKASWGEKPGTKLGPQMEKRNKAVIRWQTDVETKKKKDFQRSPLKWEIGVGSTLWHALNRWMASRFDTLMRQHWVRNRAPGWSPSSFS